MSSPSTISLVAAASVIGIAAVASVGTPAWQRDDPGQVVRGRRIYASECAACHGANLEGQPNWWRPGADGLLPAPPHSIAGHTWQHSDRELTALVANSVTAFAAPDYRTAMPAYAGRLSPAAIEDVIGYIKSTWPAGHRAWQAAQNPGGPTLADLPGDWVFPGTCDYHLQP